MPAVAYDPETNLVYEQYNGKLTGVPVDSIVGGDPSRLSSLPTPEQYAAGGSVAPATAPLTPAPSAPIVSPGARPTAASVLAKRDAVMGPLQLASGSQAKSVQRGVAPDVLDPILQSNTDATEKLASSIEQTGAAKSQRILDTATAGRDTALSEAGAAKTDAAQNRQNAEINRLNKLAISAQTDPQIDPDRYVKNMSTGKSIGMILLAAINGAFKGVVGQQGNDVMDLFRARVDRDIAAQKEQIASGRIRRGNIIQSMTDQGLSLEAAAKAAEALAYAKLERVAQLEGERATAPEAKEQAALIAQQMRAETERANNETRLAIGTDRTTEQVTQGFAAPKPAGGGDNAKKIKEALELDKTLEERGYTKEQRQAAITAMGLPVAGGKSAPELAREEKAAGKAEPSDQRTARAQVEKIQQIDNELSGIPQETVWTPEGRNFITRAANEGVDKIFGKDTWRKVFVSEEEKNAARAFALSKNQLMSASAVMMGQGALGDQERIAVDAAIQAASSPAELRAAAGQILRLAKAGERGITGQGSGQGQIASEDR
jgi:hypothetical protein